MCWSGSGQGEVNRGEKETCDTFNNKELKIKKKKRIRRLA